jgi:hypothetical protein
LLAVGSDKMDLAARLAETSPVVKFDKSKEALEHFKNVLGLFCLALH